MTSYKRLAILVIYEEQGRLFDSVIYLAKQIKKNVNYFLIVVNGKLAEIEKIKCIADDILVRDNRGYDAGAYIDGIEYLGYQNIADNYDELLLCNDTFWGPFISLDRIYSYMDYSKADFWGLNYYSAVSEKNFIHSYFYVFRRNILNNYILKHFFNDYLKGKINTYQDVLINFERGMFDFLVKKGYQFDAFCHGRYRNLTQPYECIVSDKLPILKKKCCQSEYYDEQELKECIDYIIRNTGYPINYLIDELRERYNILIEKEKLNEFGYGNRNFRDVASLETLKRFEKIHQKIYIYGTGILAKIVVSLIDPEKIKAFVVSDNINLDEICLPLDRPIFRFSQLDNHDIALIIAMSEKNTNEVYDKFKDVQSDNILFIR